MEQQGHQHALDVPLDHAGAPAAGDGANGDHVVDAQDFKNMRLAIGTLDKTIFEISLSDNLTDTRHIDVRLRQNNRPVVAPVQEAAQGSNAPPEHEPAVAPGQAVGAPANTAPAPAPQCRLKITVAAERDGDNKEDLQQMRGWLMTVATLFVSMAFQAASQPPGWMPKPEDWVGVLFPKHRKPFDIFTVRKQAWKPVLYLVLNTLTFSMGLTVVVMMLTIKESRARRTMQLATVLVVILAFFVGCNFAVGISNNWRVTGYIFCTMVSYALLAVFLVLTGATQHMTSLFRHLIGRLTGTSSLRRVPVQNST